MVRKQRKRFWAKETIIYLYPSNSKLSIYLTGIEGEKKNEIESIDDSPGVGRWFRVYLQNSKTLLHRYFSS